MGPGDDQPFGGTERFRVVRALGKGSFGVVYEVYDREHDAIVALKVLRAAAPDAIVRFKQEFRALADLAHPNLVALHELAWDGTRWFFTMERIDGVTLLEHARGRTLRDAPSSSDSTLRAARAIESAPTLRSGSDPSAPIEVTPPAGGVDPERLRGAIAQLAAGLAALHAAGKLHRDVKPSNALVTPSGRVVLLDFGLVTELAGEADAMLVGTPAYMSPEQAAGEPLTPASDLFSVGVVLLEALCGELPFRPSSVTRILLDRVDGAIPDVDALAPDAPADLRALCQELLQRDPARRPSAEELIRRLSPDARRAPRVPRRIPFVGRAGEREALGELLQAVERGEPAVAFIHGPSGVGKTALARRVLDDARARGATVLAGRCYEQERLPYKTLDGVIDALVDRWSRRPVQDYADRLPPDAGALARLFPALLRLAGVTTPLSSEGEKHDLRRRAFSAFRELLARAARAERLILFVDDLHWGDVDGAQLLAEALRDPAPPLALVATYRSEAREAPALEVVRRALPRAAEVKLSTLSREETAALALAIAPEAPLPQLDALVRESEGLPFLVGELVRLSAERPGAAAGGQTTVERVVRARLEALPEGANALLRVLAIAGQPIPRALTRELGGVTDEPTAFSALRAAGLVRASSSEGLVEPYHDRIRETVLAGIPRDEAAALHGALAHALEARGAAEPERLAQHYEAAGDLGRAAVFTERAADRAFDALAFEQAARLYARALELVPPGATAERAARLHERRGDALADAGRSAEAADAYAEAARGARAGATLDLELKRADHLLRAGLIDRGVSAARSLLARLGVALPRGRTALYAGVGLDRARIALRGLEFEARREADCDAADLLRFDMCSALALALSRGEPLMAAFAHGRAFRVALDAGEPSRVHRALFVEACAVLVLGGEDRLRELKRRIAGLRQFARTPSDARALDMIDAIESYLRGRWRDSRERLTEFERFLVEQCRGVAWEIDTVRAYLLAALHLTGEYQTLIRRVDEILADAVARGDRYQQATLRVLYTNFTALLQDDPARARQEIERGLATWGIDRFTIPHFWARYGECEAALYEGDGERALAAAQELLANWHSTMSHRVEYLRVLTHHLHGRAAIACAISAPARRSAALKTAGRAARQIERQTIPWAAPSAALLRAAIAHLGGDGATALRELDAAASVCAAEGLAAYEAIARRALAIHRSDPAGRTAAEERLRASGVQAPERLARTFAPGVT